MGLSARVTRVVGQIGDRRLVLGVRAGVGNGAGRASLSPAGGTPPFVRHRQVGASLSGLIAGRYLQSRVGSAATSVAAVAPWNVRACAATAGLVCGAMRPIGE